MAMEKSSSKYRTQFWYVAMVSFLLWLVLLYLFSSSATTVHTHERFFRQENVINLPINVPKRYQESDQAALPVDDVPQHDQESDQAVVVSDVDNNNTLPVNNTGNDTSQEVQISEDAKVVTDLVEELEKEKIENEKKSADSGLSGRTTRSRSGHREPRKARPSSRLEAEKKRVRHNDENDVESKKERVDDNDDTESKQVPDDLSNNDLESDNTSETISKPKIQRDLASNKTVSKAKNRVTSRRNRPKPMVRPRATRRNDPCRGKYVYMHDVPSLFNEELLKNCWTLSRWTDMCELTSNFGLGPRLPNMEGVSCQTSLSD
ncbi:Exostosin family protein [Raphanus sativus]|nr:Exostosin family protein [Raphanus sativus]